MSEQRIQEYEGMFLLSQAAAADMGSAVQHIRDILDRASAEVIAMSKWDERRFAFDIKRQRRGTYILAYFRCDTRNLPRLERDCNLSEQILRMMVLRADHLTEEEMKSTDAQQALADEANLRRDQGAGAGSETESAQTTSQTASQPASAEN